MGPLKEASKPFQTHSNNFNERTQSSNLRSRLCRVPPRVVQDAAAAVVVSRLLRNANPTRNRQPGEHT